MTRQNLGSLELIFWELINGVPKAGFSAERRSSAKLKNNFVRYEVLLKSKALLSQPPRSTTLIDGVSIADFSTELHSFTKFEEQFFELLELCSNSKRKLNNLLLQVH
ncbi:hypothetical protein [Staphylococcus felis]|uniref:hypothetical protein n=1 Tax=Staphylococcus felis TaxID=46127 RepID=UPI00115BA04E|nr:hypothetical protein [Staphylococcus felis]